MRGGAPEAGFSLVETLVALAVIAAMTGMLFQAIAVNASATAHLQRKRQAVMLAQSLLAQATIPSGAGDLADQGQWNDMSWRLLRRSIGGEARDTGAPLQEVGIVVTDRMTARPLVVVRTVRLAR